MGRRLDDRITPRTDAAQTVLASFLQLVEKHDLQFVPPAGGVSPLTSNVILFLMELSEYEPVLSTIQDTSIQLYAQQVLERLMANIQGKAKHYKDDIVLSNLFLMNNENYAYTAIQESPLSKFVDQRLMSKIDDLMTNGQNEYLKNTWEAAAMKLRLSATEKEEFGKLNPKRMNKKQRMTIKHQFGNFRQAVDEILSKHRGYHMKNAGLMRTVYGQAIDSVMADYEKFWTFWKDKGFSKTPEKWIAYQPATLAEIITRLYGQDRKKTT
jgi:exocyst complex protein 7